MPIVRKCLICDKSFVTKNFFIKRGQGKYCSRDCKYVSTRKGKMVECYLCKKEIYRPPKQIKGSKSKKYFCDKSCQTTWRNQVFVGPKHANWKHGLSSYQSVLRRHKIPEICNLCKTKDSRVLAVHHIDRNRKNNKVTNLAWLCHNCHFLVHHDINEKQKFLAIIS